MVNDCQGQRRNKFGKEETPGATNCIKVPQLVRLDRMSFIKQQWWATQMVLENS
jgi:hypothetical protein